MKHSVRLSLISDFLFYRKPLSWILYSSLCLSFWFCIYVCSYLWTIYCIVLPGLDTSVIILPVFFLINFFCSIFKCSRFLFVDFFFYPQLRTFFPFFFFFFESRREKEKHWWEKQTSIASCMRLNWGWTPNLGMCPNWESILETFGLWNNAPTYWPGPFLLICIAFIFTTIFHYMNLPHFILVWCQFFLSS